jgi:hypothetical protein
MKEIIIDIGNDAEISVETRGFQGKTCVEDEDVKFLKHLLGKELIQQLTPAYYVSNKQRIKKYLKLCG